jgi:crossover junction endodeoxyribonuclease RuvC
MIIIGIDPGTATTGYGIIRKKRKFKYLDCGTIKTLPSSTTPKRLKVINNELSKIISAYQPNALAMETVFFFKNSKTIIPVSQAQGVILLTAAKKGVPVYQFSPLEVKMTITGYGRADKQEVQKKIKKMLRLKKVPKSDDAVDALAIALTCFLKEEV